MPEVVVVGSPNESSETARAVGEVQETATEAQKSAEAAATAAAGAEQASAVAASAALSTEVVLSEVLTIIRQMATDFQEMRALLVRVDETTAATRELVESLDEGEELLPDEAAVDVPPVPGAEEETTTLTTRRWWDRLV